MQPFRASVLVAVVAALVAAAPADAARLKAGVGRADITPQTGYYLGGWTRADRTSHGQQTRLLARALVLDRGGRKLALVAVDLFMVPGGMVKHIGDALASRGFSERNILISASHTHSGPGGYANFNTYNTAAPGINTITDPGSYVRLAEPLPADRQLYTFLTQQISAAIRRADDNRGPAAAGWGQQTLVGLTRNRSLEAHLADHGILLNPGAGKESDDPQGYVHTIDPNVNVLRVDKLVRRPRSRRRRRMPIGIWSTFANHGTVTKATFQYYNEDHHGSATKVVEDRLRRAGRVPRSQEVVNVYGNTDEGDMSAGLDRSGPAASDFVGRVEAAAMLRAWKQAGRRLSRTPTLDLRWTRRCFCGQTVAGGMVASHPAVGLPFLTGSEEERGPLFDVTHVSFEGRRNPIDLGEQGHKLGLSGVPGDLPAGFPLMAVRIGDGVIVSVPGEATKEVGARIRGAVLAAVRGSGVTRAIVSGLVNEYLNYFTTPEEYDRQHYEGGSTYWGRLSSVLIKDELATLAGRLVHGQPAQAPIDIDPTNGVLPNGPAYPSGAARGTIRRQPAPFNRRLGHVLFSWHGGLRGLDRPVDKSFVIVQWRVTRRRHGRLRRRWRRVTSDLGLQMLWKVDDAGNYEAMWEIPLSARRGRYRMIVQAKRYRLVSNPFRVLRAESLRLQKLPIGGGRVGVRLIYPDAIRDVDITSRPQFARGGIVDFNVGGREIAVLRRRSTIFTVRAPAGTTVTIGPRQAGDRYGNVALGSLRLQG